MRPVPAPRIVAALVACGLGLAACTGGSGDPSASGSASPSAVPTGDPSSTATDVDFTPCGAQFACSGKLGETPYDIRLPETWNGTLLIYSHGLRPVDPVDPADDAFTPTAEAAPGLAGGVARVADALLEKGYALAGAGAPTGGWTVTGAVDAVDALHAAFATHVGVPDRVLTWGASLGGLTAARAGQEYPWVNGTASLCGILAGLNPNLDLALDTAVAVKALLEPDLKLTGYRSVKDARRNYRAATKAVEEAAVEPTGAGRTALQVIAAIGNLPTQSANSSGGTSAELAQALVENLEPVLARTTLERFRIEEQYGGNPSSNAGVNYGARITFELANAIDAAAPQGEGTTLRLVRAVAAVPEVAADEDARTAADEAFPRPSALAKPIITLHTSADPAAILANETLFGGWAAQASGADIRWLNVNVSNPPKAYPKQGPAPYGAGHCNFTAQSVIGAVEVLDDWVRLGRFPTWAGNVRAFGANSGFAGPVSLPAWPLSPTTQDQ